MKAYIAHLFSQLATLGIDENGAQRLAFTDADRDVISFLRTEMEILGLQIHTDAFGNIYAIHPGNDPNAPAILSGSHSDSVPNGGAYDGIVGVVCALAAVRQLIRDKCALRAPIGILLFRNEESSRFGAATLGSRAATGKLNYEQTTTLQDKAGISLAEALRQESLSPESLGNCLFPFPIGAFLEVHIEQGRVLEDADLSLGIVTSIAAATRARVTISGRADHSGATPMHLRADALCAAAECILRLEHLAAHADPIPVVGTVGIIEATPGVMNVIPGEVTLGVDIRSGNAQAKEAVYEDFCNACRTIGQARHIDIHIRQLSNETPVPLSTDMQALLTRHATTLGISHIAMPSGAGHDSMYMAPIVPTGMLFIPCLDGRSHCREEHAELCHIVSAAQVLTAAMRELAE